VTSFVPTVTPFVLGLMPEGRNMVHTTGAANHLSYGDVAELDSAAAYTLAFWWLTGVFSSDGHGIMGKPNASGAFRLIRRGSSNIGLQGTGICNTTGGAFTDALLCHLAVTLSSGGIPIFYKNGVVVPNDGATVTTGDGGAGGLLIGQETTNNTDGPNDFGHLKIWNAVLTPSEILREIYSYVPQKTANLILWCPFDDKTDFGNYANSTYTATQTGAVTQTTGGEPTLYGAELESGQLILPQRYGRRTSRSRWNAFRPFGKLVPHFQDPR
jgi:hypothetical protein